MHEPISSATMANLYNMQARRFNASKIMFTRPLMHEIEWNEQLICIKGARGSGKTTLLLQYANDHYPKSDKLLYVTMDDLLFETGSLLGLADTFFKQGGEVLMLDEIHRYENWSQELKNMYDTYPQLRVIVTGSSILHINEGNADLSRRAVVYHLEGLTFREYLQIETKTRYDVLTLDDLLAKHVEIAHAISEKIRPLAYFSQYLQHGYYPYFIQNKKSYSQKLLNIINLILEADIPLLKNMEAIKVHKLKRLLYMLATSVPYQPNISKLSAAIEISRPTVMEYLNYLEDAKLISMLRTQAKNYDLLTKPEKIYLDHPNLSYAIAPFHIDLGSLRESFVLNQLRMKHKVNSPEGGGDFLVNEKITIEVGGRSKDFGQIKDIANSYLAIDDIEAGTGNRIPVWLFGFLG